MRPIRTRKSLPQVGQKWVGVDNREYEILESATITWAILNTYLYAFKAGLDHFKLSKPESPNGFWALSEQIFNIISDKSEHANYLLANRDVAMRQNILF